MIAKVYSAIPNGYDGSLVEVEGDAARSLPSFNIVGMANKTISEARERVRSAITSSGFTFPDQKVTVNLAPAELTKTGSHLDLPIALATLVLSKQLLQSDLDHKLFVGELSLDGRIRSVRGIINIVETAKLHGFTEVFLPSANLPEAALIQDVKITGIDTLASLVYHLKGITPLPEPAHVVKNTKTPTTAPHPLLDDISGQALAKRALIIAIAGHHNLLLSGPPGAGKTFLARVAANLLPPPTPTEQIAIAKIHSLATSSQIPFVRPFRSPHHSASSAAIIGGGLQTAPGEISLAHHGILFLDELPEFSRLVLEALRQPLEDHVISIARANQRVTYPANFILLATMNPCPCGYLSDPTHACTCTEQQIQAYRKKISGPILDRIDLIINVEKVQTAHLLSNHPSTSREHTAAFTAIQAARTLQENRQHGIYNSNLSPEQIKTLALLSPAGHQLLTTASEKLNLSARAYYKVIKVARTIADLAESPTITAEHISEALALRQTLK